MKTQVILGKGKIMTGKRKASHPFLYNFSTGATCTPICVCAQLGTRTTGLSLCLGPGGADAVEGVGVYCGHWTI
jgi:hypothetical protein